MSEMKGDQLPELEPVASLEAFFHESMDSAMAANKVVLTIRRHTTSSIS